MYIKKQYLCLITILRLVLPAHSLNQTARRTASEKNLPTGKFTGVKSG
jgi:hypothetical protein